MWGLSQHPENACCQTLMPLHTTDRWTSTLKKACCSKVVHLCTITTMWGWTRTLQNAHRLKLMHLCTMWGLSQHPENACCSKLVHLLTIGNANKMQKMKYKPQQPSISHLTSNKACSSGSQPSTVYTSSSTVIIAKTDIFSRFFERCWQKRYTGC